MDGIVAVSKISIDHCQVDIHCTVGVLVPVVKLVLCVFKLCSSGYELYVKYQRSCLVEHCLVEHQWNVTCHWCASHCFLGDLRWQSHLLQQTYVTHAERRTDIWLIFRLQWRHVLRWELDRHPHQGDRQTSAYVRWTRWHLVDLLRECALSCWATVTLAAVHFNSILFVNLKEIDLAWSTMMVTSLA